MEPGHEDREYLLVHAHLPGRRDASMEPGHEDREYLMRLRQLLNHPRVPQWSPAMKTGNT